ncbi:hypothetical protein FSARC_14155 [Fusarium sarcochroum]|uniref:Uncharacterized protein n=1 Tax=Fusarium sarcochroum TaxID=1208366 RepID=A0A8H4SW43_9HYPO|nr:hypothetical protein FSARC_14155 [Fusarium sarcochroum]
MADSKIPSVPPPWTLKGDVYAFIFWTPRSQARDGFPSLAYSPLEAQSSFASSQKALGGLSMFQIIRYTDSPVGPYDELILAPGSFEYEKEDESGRRHLAQFTWTDNSNGSTTVKVYPHDTVATDSVGPESAFPDPIPFFQATFKPVPYTPSFPFRTSWINHFGFNTTLILPPLPEGSGSQGELPGTDRWCSLIPQQSTSKCKVGWFDVAQHRDDEGRLTGAFENFWPGWSRWQIGIKMEDAISEFDHPETWEPSRTSQ